jgi:hypothetical protein
MVEGNMGKFEMQIGLFYSRGESLFERMCTFEELCQCFKILKLLIQYLLSLAMLRD